MTQPTFDEWKLNLMKVEQNALVLNAETPKSIKFISFKASYTKHLDAIADLFNYFTKVYDTEGEVVRVLEEFSDTNYSMDTIDVLIYKLSTDSIHSKLVAMAENNAEKYVSNTTNDIVMIKNILVASYATTLILPAIFNYVSPYDTAERFVVQNKDVLKITESILGVFPESKAAVRYILTTIDTRVNTDHINNDQLYTSNNLDVDKVKYRLYRRILIDGLFRCSSVMNGINFINTIIEADLRMFKLAKQPPSKSQVSSEDKSDQKDL